jgi:beta-glucanase (GH16 family)
MIRRNILVVFSVCLFLCGFADGADPIWSQEFEAGDRPDSATWTYDVGGWGWGNGQLEYNTARRENSYIENGNLVLEARREFYQEATTNQFTSARMLTQGRFAFKYGTLEARIKMPNVGNGLWPAFWMLGNNFDAIPWPECGEIDIVEIGSKEGIQQGLQNRKINAAIHYDTVDDGGHDPATYDYDAGWLDAPVDLHLDYHLYKLVWTPTDVTAYLDGVAYWSFDITADYLREFHQPHYPILNIAVGSWPTGYTGISDPAGITAPFPARMYVDWIRLYSHPQTEIFLGVDHEESGSFGIFTETTPVSKALTFIEEGQEGPDFNYGDEAVLYIWNNLTEANPMTPSEGSTYWSFDAAPGTWYGMGVMVPTFRNMKNYSDGYLHMDLATTTNEPIKVGIKSSVGGESWLHLEVGEDQFGLVRDGDWHEVRIPLNRFSNTDFQTVHQMLMIAGDPPASAVNLSIDNVWWEPSTPKPTPENGNFGVYTENASHKNAGEFVLGTDGDFFVWAHTLVDDTQTPYEGTESLSLKSAPGLNWFGCAFTPNRKYNLTAFRYPESKLRFSLKTGSSAAFRIGMKSGNIDGVGQKWITFQAGSDPYGFVRDGQWHVVEIPMSDFMTEVDLTEVSQFFEILGTSGPISGIEIDDIYFAGGGDPLVEGSLPPTVSITSPDDGQFFSIGDTIAIEAEASAAEGAIAKVEFFEGVNLLGEDVTAPYSYTWTDVAGGSYLITAKAIDTNGLTRNASIRVYVGEPELTTLSVSPSSATVEVGQTRSFTAAGKDQFGLPFAVSPSWSADGGGAIDAAGLFSASIPGSNFTVTAQAGSLTADAAVSVTKPTGTCTGGPVNGEYTYAVSGESVNPTITFVPGYPGVGNGIVILYYGTNAAGVYPGYVTSPNTPFRITAGEGQTVYFYYTYSVPEGGEHNTSNARHSVIVGDCAVLVPGDINGDGVVGMDDLATLAYYWLDAACGGENDFCYGADTQPDGIVNLLDLAELAAYWQN